MLSAIATMLRIETLYQSSVLSTSMSSISPQTATNTQRLGPSPTPRRKSNRAEKSAHNRPLRSPKDCPELPVLQETPDQSEGQGCQEQKALLVQLVLPVRPDHLVTPSLDLLDRQERPDQLEILALRERAGQLGTPARRATRESLARLSRGHLVLLALQEQQDRPDRQDHPDRPGLQSNHSRHPFHNHERE